MTTSEDWGSKYPKLNSLTRAWCSNR